MTSKKEMDTTRKRNGEMRNDPMEGFYYTNSEMYNNEWSVKMLVELLVKSLVSEGLVFMQADKFMVPLGRLDIVMRRLVLPFVADAIRQKAITGLVVYALVRITKMDAIGRSHPELLGFPYPKVLEEGQYALEQKVYRGSVLRKVASVSDGLVARDMFLFEYNLLSCRTTSLDTILVNSLKPLVYQLVNLESSMMAWERAHGKPPIMLTSATNIAKNLTSDMDPAVESSLDIFNETGEVYLGVDALNFKRLQDTERMNTMLRNFTKHEVLPSWKQTEQLIQAPNSRIFLPDHWTGTQMSPTNADSTYVLRREELLKSMYNVVGFTMKSNKRSNDRRTDDQPRGARELSEQTISEWGAMIHLLLEEMLPQMWTRLSKEQEIYDDNAPAPRRDKTDENVYHVYSLSDLINIVDHDNKKFEQNPADKTYIDAHKTLKVYLKSVLLSDPLQAMKMLEKGLITEELFQVYFPNADLTAKHEELDRETQVEIANIQADATKKAKLSSDT